MEPSCSDKAVILARGLGQRMRRDDATAALDAAQAGVAATGMKALIPVGRPFLDYVLSALAEAGYRRVCLVVGPEHDALRDYYGRQLQPQRLKITFAVQEQPKGTADAVTAAESFAAGEAFTVINSDNYYPVEALSQLRRQAGSAVALFDWQSMLAGSNLSEERLRRFAVAEFDERGFLRRIIEKPGEATWALLPRPLWLGMNCWRFRPTIFEACRAISPSPRGELEITTAVQYAIDVLGEPFCAIKIHAPVLDLTSRADIAPVAAMLSGKDVCL